MPARPPSSRNAASAAPSSRRGSLGAAVLEVWHHMLGEGAQAIEHHFLRHRLVCIEQEVNAVDADRLPLLAGAQHALGVADRDALGDARIVTGACRLTPERRQQAERLIRLARIGLAR